jgi:hypothetical protein
MVRATGFSTMGKTRKKSGRKFRKIGEEVYPIAAEDELEINFG